MRVGVLKGRKAAVARGAVILLLCGTATGCSSTVSRFGGLDSLFTASTPQAQAGAVPASQQPYPSPATPIAAAPASPVQRSSLAAPAPAAPRTTEASPLAPKPLAPKAVAARVPLPAQPPAERVASLEKPKLVAPAPVKPAKVEPEHKAEPAATADAHAYVVATGDSWNIISRKTGVAVADLKAANPASAAGLQIGQTLTLKNKAAPAQVAEAKPAPALDPMPTAGTPKAETQPVSYQPQAPAKQVLADAEASKDEAPDASGVGKMRWPVRGRVVARYGAKGAQASDGLDIAVPEGTPIKAAENGVVIYAGDGLKEFGNTVLVRHENGLVTVYGHASQIKVTRGEKVTRGQDIALSGMSGTTDTPKLHFEVRKNSAPVDPATFLQ